MIKNLVRHDDDNMLDVVVKSAYEYHPTDELSAEDVDSIEWVGYHVEWNDGDNISAIGVIPGGRWVTLYGGCDYTGWDCQSGADWYVTDSYEDAYANGLTNEMRGLLGIERVSPRHREVDWLGNEYGVGDVILYPRSMGRSVEMVKGVVVSFHENKGYMAESPIKVKIKPVSSSRFNQADDGDEVLITIVKNITKIVD